MHPNVSSMIEDKRMKKNQRKTVLLFLLLFAVICFHAGIYVSGEREIVLEFGMFTGSNWDVENVDSFVIFDKAIERFEAEHPGVKIHYYSGVPKEDYSEWFSRKLLAGQEPDVFMILRSDFNQFSSLGVMKDLGELMETDPEFDSGKYFTSAFGTGQYGNVQYALPYETVPKLMFVNKTLLTKEQIDMPEQDWTWEEMYRICEMVTKDLDGDHFPDQFGIYNYGWMDAVCSNGGEIFEADGSGCCFTDERIIEAVKYVQQLEELNQGQKIIQEDFSGGSVAFMPLTFAEYRTYKTYPYKIKQYANFQWDCITMPSGSHGANRSQVDTLLMGISANTKHEKLAWEFLKILTYEEEVQMEIFRHSQGASVLKSVTQSSRMEEIIQADMEEGDTVISGNLLGRVLEEGYISPQFKRYEQAMSLADSEVGKIVESKKAVDSSLKILQRTINDYLRQ